MQDYKSQVEQKVIELAAEQAGVDPSSVTRQSHFVNDLHFDSLDKVEFAMELEDEFEISIPDEKTEDMQIVDDVVRYVLESDQKREQSDKSEDRVEAK